MKRFKQKLLFCPPNGQKLKLNFWGTFFVTLTKSLQKVI